MKILIVFTSSHGTTEKAAYILSTLLDGEVDIVDLRVNASQDVMVYDAVIIGASIHAGSISRKVKHFITKNQDELASKKIGLFLCCMWEGEVAQEQFEQSFPKQLRDLSVSNGLFGGEFIFEKMNFIEKQIVRIVNGATEDVSKLDVESIKVFANKFNAVIPCGV
ncbi:MAG TPA: flavodoxin [Bacillus bacterium]|nr:flavodoxin [Bacillus sp. (in: firmicutes)]